MPLPFFGFAARCPVIRRRPHRLEDSAEARPTRGRPVLRLLRNEDDLRVAVEGALRREHMAAGAVRVRETRYESLLDSLAAVRDSSSDCAHSVLDRPPSSA